MGTKVYKVDVERDGRFWLVHVPEIKRSTQARNLGEIEAMAQDLIGIMIDREPDAIQVEVVVRVPAKALEHIEESQRLRAAAIEANAGAASALRAGVREMVEAGFTVRDIGRLLDVSHQRVHQLASDQERPREAAPEEDPANNTRSSFAICA